MMMDAMTVADAVCVLANYRQFHAGESLRNPRVESRMLLWRLGGAGELTVNGRRQELGADEMLLLPWAHSVGYQAAATDPYLLAGVHIVPRHAPGESETGTRHGHATETNRAPDPRRQDADWPWLRGLQRLRAPVGGALRLQAAAIVERWQAGPPADWERRLQARLMLAVLAQALAGDESGQAGRAAATSLPAELRHLTRQLREGLDAPIRVEEMAAMAGCSVSTVGRLFKQHLGCTPITWLRRQRVERACELLATTPLSIGQIAADVGMPDVPYFAKTFKRITGEPPATYRKRVRVF